MQVLGVLEHNAGLPMKLNSGTDGGVGGIHPRSVGSPRSTPALRRKKETASFWSPAECMRKGST